MTIYIDLIILSNFLLDYSIIAYTGVIAGEKTKLSRLFLASLFAVASLVLFFIELTFLFLIIRIIWSMGIVFLAFQYRSFTQYLKNLLLFYLLNYVCAGIIISYDFQFYDNAIYLVNDRLSWILLLFSFLFANILTYTYKVIIEKNAKIKATIYDIKFRFLGTIYSTKGLLDTGNVVCSEDNTPVVFIDKEFFDLELDERVLLKKEVKYTYINYKTVKGNYATLAIKPDYFQIKLNDKYESKEVYLAVLENIQNKEYSFNVILNYQILF